MAFALLGVMAMQFYFLRQSYVLQLGLFDGTVNEALRSVVTRIGKQDANRFLINRIRMQNPSQNTSKHSGFVFKLVKRSVKVRHKKGKLRSGLIINDARSQRLAYLKDSLRRLTFDEIRGSLNFQLKVEEYTDEYGNVSQSVTPQITNNTIDPRELVRIHGKLRKYIDTAHLVYMDPSFGRQVISVPRINPLWQQEQEHKKKAQLVKQVQKLIQAETADTPNRITQIRPDAFETLHQEYQQANEPLKNRVNIELLDTLLRAELQGRGINLPFSYEVLTLHNDSLIFSKANDPDGAKPVFLAGNTYQAPIFNNDVVNDPGNLKLSFPQKNSLILSNMAGTMATTAGLLLVLVFCFGYTIYSIIKQKKISEMKTDFINNMTHEFKTPVSTIMIASEALKDAEIAEDKTRVARLANIIYEENVRLGSHIERVLNIARIEKDDFRLDIKHVDVNEMITTVLDSMLLKLQKHEAQIDLNLGEEDMLIKADELHFSNVIYNLIDNAIKYSREAPEINISTQVKGGTIIIRVADKGIGMSAEQQSKIFEQFYRAPTGNLHDVKGFGLGLSYVNTIVKRLNGSIAVKSEKDKGSEFELKFDRVSFAKAI